MAKVKYFTRTSKRAKKEVNIRVRFWHGRLFDLTAQIQKTINPYFWNNETGEPRKRLEFHDYENFKSLLYDLEKHLIGCFENEPYKEKINLKWLDNKIDLFYFPQKHEPKKQTFFQFIQFFIANCSTRQNENGGAISKDTINNYKLCFNDLQGLAAKQGKTIDWHDIDYKFYLDLVQYLQKEKKYSNNTVGKRIKVLKIFLNDAIKRDIYPKLQSKIKDFKVTKEETDSIYLTENELKELNDFDFSRTKRLENVRDLFIFACYTGLRFSDLRKINEFISGDMIQFYQQKTGKKVKLPLHPTAKKILEKHDNSLPPVISGQKFNKYIKQACEIAGINEVIHTQKTISGKKVVKKSEKWEQVSAHTARRTFATNEFKAGTPSILIMAATGHKTEKAFLRYLKITEDEKAEMLQDLWRKRGEHLKAI